MEVKGIITHALPETSGTSKQGNPWKKREYVMEYGEGQYPRKMAFTCFGENADKIVLQPGQTVTVYFDVESREWNGRWYTDIRCWRADIEQPGQPVSEPVRNVGPGIPPPPPAPSLNQEDELPF